MITFGTKNFSDGNWFMIRSWDGYDKPEYFKVFEITEEEMELVGGRFVNHDSAPFLEKSNTIKVDQPVDNIEEIIGWIYENIANKWFIDIEQWFEDNIKTKQGSVFGRIIFYFEDKEDATGFKLRWLQE